MPSTKTQIIETIAIRFSTIDAPFRLELLVFSVINRHSSAKCDVAGIGKALQKYTVVETKFVAIATIYEQCYICQMEQALKGKQPASRIEGGIKKYISIFK